MANLRQGSNHKMPSSAKYFSSPSKVLSLIRFVLLFQLTLVAVCLAQETTNSSIEAVRVTEPPVTSTQATTTTTTTTTTAATTTTTTTQKPADPTTILAPIAAIIETTTIAAQTASPSTLVSVSPSSSIAELITKTPINQDAASNPNSPTPLDSSSTEKPVTTTSVPLSSTTTNLTTPESTQTTSSAPTTNVSILTVNSNTTLIPNETSIQEGREHATEEVRAAPVETTTNASNSVEHFNSNARIVSSNSTKNANSTETASATTQINYVDGARAIIDLSHPLEDSTIHWPLNNGFNYTVLISREQLDQNNKSSYYKTDSFTMGIHTGTHLDAPRHFNANGWSVDEIPLHRLVDVPITVIDVSNQVRSNRSYSVSKNDLMNERGESAIKPATIVLVYTGISQVYEQGKAAYYGNEEGNLLQMNIPGFSRQAAEFLAELGIYGVGLDAPSADSSTLHAQNDTIHLIAHRIFANHNIYILENISKQLRTLLNSPKAHFYLSATPLAIKEGSGSPVRVIAQVAHEDSYIANDSTSNHLFYPYLLPLLVTLLTFILLSSHF